ncbi:MAG: peptide-methionine (S)-S-oxide reductase MsrA [bacterium]|nr:peptide-methionine (S)-S-oxide reductase MsrA [bacterium]
MNKEIAVFGGGCFWCTEAVFKMLKGVSIVKPGYAGGIIDNPTYDQVCGGKTGHAEVIHIEFDPSEIKYDDLLTVFFASHDPSTLNRQGNDVGTQYRSVVFYTTLEQKEATEKFIKDLNDSSLEGKPAVTEVTPLPTFYEAENYHHDYFANHPENGYCEVIINPKVEKVQKKFADLLKANNIS